MCDEVKKCDLFGLFDKLIVIFNFARNGEARRSMKREAKLRVKWIKFFFEVKFRFA